MSAAALPARILVRADAGPELGGGHIMRCLALAASLKARGASIAFACAPGSSDLVPALSRSGFAVMTARSAADFDLPPAWGGQADAILVDLYTSTRADESRMRQIAPVIAVLEDLPDRVHDCDLLGDQGFDRQPADYADRVPPGATLLLGPDMTPLRPDFARLRSASLARRLASPGLSRLLVSMGMTDVGGISAQIVALARKSLPDITIDVILGPLAPSLPGLLKAAENDPKLHILVDVDRMAECVMAADLAIGAGGGSALERCVLGVPSLVIVLAENQRPAARAMATAGAALMIETPQALADALPALLRHVSPPQLAQMSARAARLCDGRGAERIATALLARIARPPAPANA
ncbi:UDP-2,4-diacetamido-2,4,6-trideoxy-beta-L-altropyranose hydrolase [Maricaulis salignorans]|uniref:UDP-2,4-diacetamido-2,4, 6-trideoxy-beta-L-altropyranose hydrolase n=1 Tax=Maricaulis salignorans TaxID=144026 RepID=UPI003A92835D